MKKEFEDYFERNGITVRDVLVTDEKNEYVQYVDRSLGGEHFVDVTLASEGKYKAKRTVWGDRNVMISLREHDISIDIDRINRHITAGDYLVMFNFFTGRHSFSLHYDPQGEANDGVYVTESESDSLHVDRATTTIIKPKEDPRSLGDFSTYYAIEDQEDRYKLVGQGKNGVQLELDYPKKIDLDEFTAVALGDRWKDILRNADPETGFPKYPSLRFSYLP